MSEAPTQFECIVSADLFRRALAAVSKEETRYYLNGVNIEACPTGGALLVATDGSRMIVLHDPEGVVRGGTGIVQLNASMIKALSAKVWRLPNWIGQISSSTSKRFLIVRGAKAAVAEVEVPETGLDVEAALAMADAPTQNVGGYQWMGALIEGKFPDWRRVVGKPDPVSTSHGPLDPKILAPIAEALTGSGKSVAYRGCYLVPTEGDVSGSGPVFVFTLGASSGFGIVMPVRDHGSVARALPDWMTPPVAMAAE